jgi:MoxR-like ATPase
MMMIKLDYPDYSSELDIVKQTTSDRKTEILPVIDHKQIIEFQELVRKVPVVDNVFEYAVSLVHKTRPGTEKAAKLTDEFIEWGAGPRASQFLILGAKCHAIISGKYSPDIEDVQAIAEPVLRHRIVRNFKAEAEGMTEEKIIEELL